MWASPMWSLIALIFISMIPNHIFQNHKKGLAKGLVIWLSAITLLMACYLQFGGKIRHKASRMDWPQQKINKSTIKKMDSQMDRGLIMSSTDNKDIQSIHNHSWNRHLWKVTSKHDDRHKLPVIFKIHLLNHDQTKG